MKRISLSKLIPETTSLIVRETKIVIDRLIGKSETENLHRQLEQIAYKNKALISVIKELKLSKEQRETVNKIIPILDKVSTNIFNREKISKEEADKYIKATDKLIQVLNELPDNLSASLNPIIRTLTEVLKNSKVSIETKYQVFKDTLDSLVELNKLPKELEKYRGIDKDTFLKYQKDIIKTLADKSLLQQFKQEEKFNDLIAKFDELTKSKELFEKKKDEKSLAQKFLERPLQLARGRGFLSGAVELGFSMLGMPGVGQLVGDLLEGTIGDYLFKGLGKGLRFGGKLLKLGGNKLLGKVGGRLALSTLPSLLPSIPALANSGIGLLSKGVGLLGGASRILPGVGLLATAGYSLYKGFKGWQRANEIFGTDKATLGQKTSAGIGGALSGLTFGLLPEDTVAKFVYKIGDLGVEFFKKVFDFNPILLTTKVSKYLFNKVQDFGSSIANGLSSVKDFLWNKFTSIGKWLENTFYLPKIPSLLELIKNFLGKFLPGFNLFETASKGVNSLLSKGISSVKSFFGFGNDNKNEPKAEVVNHKSTSTVTQSEKVYVEKSKSSESKVTQPIVVQQLQQEKKESPTIPTQKEIDSYGIAFTNALLFD